MTATNPTRARWRAEGRCPNCGSATSGEFVHCDTCREVAARGRREQRPAAAFPASTRVRVWRWGPTPSGNPPDLARLPKSTVVGVVAKSGEGQFYTVDFPAPYGRLQVLESEMVKEG